MRSSRHTVTRLLQEGMRRNGPSVAESLFTLERDTGVGASHRGVLSGHGLLARDEETQPRAATVGADLQHGAATSVARLLNPAAVPAAGFISEKGMKSVTNLLGMTLLGTFT